MATRTRMTTYDSQCRAASSTKLQVLRLLSVLPFSSVLNTSAKPSHGLVRTLLSPPLCACSACCTSMSRVEVQMPLVYSPDTAPADSSPLLLAFYEPGHYRSVADAFNVCAVTIDNRRAGVTVIVVYRAPWATYDDTKSLFNQLDAIVSCCTERIIIAGDFNLPHIDWCATAPASSGHTKSLLTLFATEQFCPAGKAAYMRVGATRPDLCDVKSG
jgi:hypothetical protein